MSKTYKIKKGKNIKLQGAADKIVQDYFPKFFALKPTDFNAVVPKMLIEEGEQILAGQELFYDKKREYLRFTSPVSGILKQIKRGKKRRIEEIIIEADETQQYYDFKLKSIEELQKNDIINAMLKSGVWPVIRQRPYNIIANPEDNPKAIFIKAFDSAPLAPDYDLLVKQEMDLLQKGIDVLQKITAAPIHFNLHKTLNNTRMYDDLQGVDIRYFEGKHPVGNLSVQIFKISPINKGDIVWHLDIQDLIYIARFFEEGKVEHQKIFAFCGSELTKPMYYKSIQGASISELIQEGLKQDNVRIISGNVLNGEKLHKNGSIGFYDNQITVIPEGNHYSFLGWILPGFKKYSFSRTYFSWLQPNKKRRLHTNLNGGKRPFVMTGIYEKYLPMDILPMQLCKAVLVNDIDEMENLGIYEVVPEDFALAEFACPSKIDMQAIIAEGLEVIHKEMS